MSVRFDVQLQEFERKVNTVCNFDSRAILKVIQPSKWSWRKTSL